MSNCPPIQQTSVAGGYAHIGVAPPTNPCPMDLWFCENEDGRASLFVYYPSCNGNFWVEVTKDLV